MAYISGDNSLTLSRGAAWVGEARDSLHLVPGGVKLDRNAFLAPDGTYVRLTANAAAGAIALTVAALSAAVPANTLLYFGPGLYARTTANAARNATTVAVEALPAAIANGSTATYAGTQMKSVRSGTAIGRTYAERDTNAPYGPAADTDDEVFLLAFDVTNLDLENDGVLYKPNSVVRENYLPGTLSAAVLGKIRANYICVRGS